MFYVETESGEAQLVSWREKKEKARCGFLYFSSACVYAENEVVLEHISLMWPVFRFIGKT